MSKIPTECLPPKEYLPDNIYLLPELNYPDKLNLADVLLDKNASERGDKIAIYYEDQRITYRELRSMANRFANALRELGIEKNDRIMTRAPNCPEYIVWIFAMWRIGAIPVLVNHLNRHEEIAFKGNDTESVGICVHSKFYEDVAKARPEIKTLKHVIVLGDKQPDTLDYQELLRGKSEEAVSTDTNKTDIARLIYSSGTTGKPKGIITTIGGLLSAADTHGRYVLKIKEDDILGGHPYFTFAFGSVNFTLYPWRFGASLSIIGRFAPDDQLRLIQEHRITQLYAVPTAFNMMLSANEGMNKYDTSSMRLCQSAGEWLPGETIKNWERRFGVGIIDSLGSGDLNYWLTTTDDMPKSKIGSTGSSVPGFENLVVDENFNEVSPGTTGELIVRGPVGQTYWRRPDVQVKAVCPPSSNYKGWSRPGLVFEKDADGYFWYKSRSDDMIVTSGYKIPGGEVEGALNNHQVVLESAVVDSPDGSRGTLIKAFVVLKEGYEASDELAKELQDHVKRTIEPYKYPRIIEFIKAEDLPRTATGKIQRNVLRERERK